MQLGLCFRHRGDLTPSRLLHQLHWLPVQQWITSSWQFWRAKFRARPPVYLHQRVAERACSRTLRSSTISLLDKPFMRTDFSRRAFRFSAPTVWNSLPQTVLISDSLSVFKSRLKTFLFNQAFTEHWSDLPPAPLKLQPYGAIEIRLLLLLLTPRVDISNVSVTNKSRHHIWHQTTFDY